MSSLIRSRPCAACLRRLRSSTPTAVRSTVISRGCYDQKGESSRSSSRFPQTPVRSVRLFSSSSLVRAKKNPREDETRRRVDMEEFPPERIRNLSIIAHIDHGKSTLADRLLQMTNTVPANSSPQFLDKLKVERERGITVKAQTVSIIHEHTDGQRYLINLIDTPGHVDFSYEVSRSLGACEGGLLLVDCTQGIQAQTLSVFHVALEADLKLLAVINKVDLPHAAPEETSEQIETSLGLESDKHMLISAKSGLGVDKVLNQIIDRLPPPRRWEKNDGKLRGLVFDTYYDHYRGVVALVRVFSGSVKVGDKVRFLQAERKYEILEIGINNPEEVSVDVLREGQVGYVICSMKNSEEAFIGDTMCHEKEPVEPLPGFKPMKAMVYAGVFPIDTADFSRLEEAIDRLTLNDRSVSVAKESSAALSQGFRLGFLGTLHMDVFRQRLEDEYSSEVIITAPTVPYKVTKGDGSITYVSNPSEFPDISATRTFIRGVEEPMVHATIIVPNEYIGQMMDLCSNYRATQLEYKVLETTGRSMLRYSFPLSEIVTDFFSELKSASSGFASFDYEEAGYEPSDMLKMNIMLNGKPVDALATIVHRSAAHAVGKSWCKKLKEVVPKQLFELAIQASIGAKVVARETLSANRKDVTAGLYGGHYERKLKHLNKQKEGKKRLKSLAGNIQVPQKAFYEVLSSRPRSRSYSTYSVRHTEEHTVPPSPPQASATHTKSASGNLNESVPALEPHHPLRRKHRHKDQTLRPHLNDFIRQYEEGSFSPFPKKASRRAGLPLQDPILANLEDLMPSPESHDSRIRQQKPPRSAPAHFARRRHATETMSSSLPNSSLPYAMLPLTDAITPNVSESISSLQPYRYFMREHKPLRSQSMTPIQRSKHLSKLFQLIYHAPSPTHRQTAENLYSTYSTLFNASQNANLLTPAEVRSSVHSLRRMNARMRVDRHLALDRSRELIGHMDSMLGRENARKHHDMDLILFYTSPRSIDKPSERDVTLTEGRLRQMLSAVPKDGSEVETSLKQLISPSDFLLRLLANTRDSGRFNSWWTELENKGIIFTAASHISKSILLRNTGSVAAAIGYVTEVVDKLGGNNQSVMFNHLLELHAEQRDWDKVQYIYTGLITSPEPLPAPFEPHSSATGTGKQVKISPNLKASRATFYIMVKWLSYHAYLEATLRILKDMYENEWEPHIPEYSALFKAFARYGVISPSLGEGIKLFPQTEDAYTEETSPDIWRRRREPNEYENRVWTQDVLGDLFEGFMNVKPSIRDVHSSEAPGAETIYSILFAWSRCSGGNVKVLRNVWERMNRKFGGGEERWNEWEMVLGNKRLVRVVEGLYREKEETQS